MATKSTLWEDWISRKLLSAIHASETLDPVPVINQADGEFNTTDEFDAYRYGRGDGQYLYLLYLINEPLEDASDIIPIYIGETRSVTSRLYQHFKRIREALPIEEWVDDGSWGSWSKYDHIAAVYDQVDEPLYAWILDVDDLDGCPYGYPTYRQELEAKLVGLVHSQSRFEQVFANREFVPNQRVHEMGKVGPDWLFGDSWNYDSPTNAQTAKIQPARETKIDLWHEWGEETILEDIQTSSKPDPIPLFDTNDYQVQLTEQGGLRRSDAIDAQIRRKGRQCVAKGLPNDTKDGLLYVMYQLDQEYEEDGMTKIIPRYIGKAEVYGKKKKLSSNFTEIVRDREATRSFARWGDGDYWHIGELSNTVFGNDTKKLAWASELFESGTQIPTLKQQVYLWVEAWDPAEHHGPYGVQAYLAEVEPLLIGLAYDAYPNQLLNYAGVPDDAPIKSRGYQFEPVAR